MILYLKKLWEIEGVVMENKDSNKTIKCDSCNAEFTEGTKFCTECGKPVENVSENNENLSEQDIICPKCQAEVSPGIKFCEECGTKIENIQISNQKTTCPKCYADVSPGTRFCEECGTKIDISTIPNQETTCPKCYAEIPPGTSFCIECGTKIGSSSNHTTCPKCYTEVEAGETFCTECGTSLTVKKNASSANINQELKRKRESSGRTIPPKDDTLDSVVESGKGLMKGLGGFINKAASEVDKNLNQSSKSGSSSNKNINAMIQKRREKKVEVPGFLVCDACGGYYELQPGEAADDFTNECECGGKLQHQMSIT